MTQQALRMAARYRELRARGVCTICTQAKAVVRSGKIGTRCRGCAKVHNFKARTRRAAKACKVAPRVLAPTLSVIVASIQFDPPLGRARVKSVTISIARRRPR